MENQKKSCRLALGSFLLFLLFFLFGLSVCTKPVCTGLIREAYIGRAIALRTNDVIHGYFPDMAADTGLTLQEMTERHAQLNAVVRQYLDALVCFAQNGDWQPPDCTAHFEKMNRDILRTVEEGLQFQADDSLRIQFLARLQEAQWEACAILNTLPSSSLVAHARPILLLYGALTSPVLRLLCLTCLLLLAVRLLYLSGGFPLWTKAVGIPAAACGIVTGVLLPACCRFFTLPVTNRFLGRSMYIDTTCFMAAGGIYAAAGTALLFTGWFFTQKRKQP